MNGAVGPQATKLLWDSVWFCKLVSQNISDLGDLKLPNEFMGSTSEGSRTKGTSSVFSFFNQTQRNLCAGKMEYQCPHGEIPGKDTDSKKV